MVEHIFDDKPGLHRMDIRTGVGRRRRWSAADKGRIVAESFASGASVSAIARQNDISPQHLFKWRKDARAGRLVLPADEEAMFATVLVDKISDRRPDPAASTPTIEIEVGGSIVRVGTGIDLRLLIDVLRAVKAAA
jgi:transposase